MIRTRFGVVLMLALSWSCRDHPRPPERLAATPQNALAAVFEAVAGPPHPHDRGLYCLAVTQQSVWFHPPKHDAPPDLITLLTERGYSVFPASRCALSKELSAKGELVEEHSGRPVTSLILEDSLVTRGDSLKTDVSYFCGDLCAGIGPVYIWQVDGRWTGRFMPSIVS